MALKEDRVVLMGSWMALEREWRQGCPTREVVAELASVVEGMLNWTSEMVMVSYYVSERVHEVG